MKKIGSLFYRIYLYFASKFRHAYCADKMILTSTPPRILGKIYINAKKVTVGKNVTFYPGVYLWGNDIEIGDNVDIGIGTIIYAKKKVKIGDNTSIAGQCYIIDSNHGTKGDILINQQPLSTAEDGILIGNDVWIAAQCSILKGAKIHNHVVVGANSLVNNEIAENSIVVGSPARLIKFRN